jgi:hypothetical protein
MPVDLIEAQLNIEESSTRMSDPDMHPILEAFSFVGWSILAWLLTPSQPETWYDPNQ